MERWACAHDGKLSKAPSDLSILLPSFEAPGACSFIHKEESSSLVVVKHISWDHSQSLQDEPSKRPF
jgi:hypothetical protein